MATHSSVLALRIPGTGEPGGLPSRGSHRVGHDWSDLATTAPVPVPIPETPPLSWEGASALLVQVHLTAEPGGPAGRVKWGFLFRLLPPCNVTTGWLPSLTEVHSSDLDAFLSLNSIWLTLSPLVPSNLGVISAPGCYHSWILVCMCANSLQLCPTLCNPMDRLFSPWDSPGTNTGAGCHFLLQGIFQTPGIEPSSLLSPTLAGGFFTSSTIWLLVKNYAAAAAAKSLQSCLTLCDPTDGSPPGCPVPGILQARTLEWVAISFSSACKWKVKVKSLSRVQLFETPWTGAH